MLSYIFLRCQRQYALRFVIRSAFSRNCKFFLAMMALFFFAVPAPALLFWAISLCTISVFIPIENPHLTIVYFGKTLRVYTQPAINLGSMLKHQMRVWAMPEWLSVLSWRIWLYSATVQNDIWIMIQKILLSTQALCATSPDFPRVYYLCSAELNRYSNSVNS